jgi:predicted metal-dependent peptidase|tara:strand:- start:1193 stop:2500 length:1308 start_codon:yes stop_codon:yes gene_type:complete
MTKNTSTTNNDKENKLAHLVGPTDPQIDKQARERLITARIGLLLRHSFFGNLATRLELVNADEWCPTAATDGKRFYYNARFIMMLRKKEVEFLVGHEVLHVVYDHMDRRGDRDPQLWNIADDYCVNADLKRHNVGEFITTVPCLYNYKYENMPAEQVYDDLYENAEFIDVDQLLEQMLDEHMDGDGEGEGAGGDEDGAGDKEGKGPVKMSQAEKDELKQEIKEAILSAAEGVEAGNLPKGVERMIKDMTAPVMDWNELIQSNVTSSFSNDYSFMKPNRRGWHMDAILPGMTPGEEIEADVFIDLSGSIGYEQGSTFLSEVGGMMSQFDGYKLRVHCFDTAVYNTKEYSSDNMEDIEQYEMYGGGGTDFDCIFNHLKEEGRVPKLLIVFTDGYPFGSWGDEDYCDTTWIIHGDPNPNPPFGTFALYEDHKNKARAA